MDRNRSAWNKHQQILQDALSSPEKHPECISLFLSQHAQVHSSRMTTRGEWSFEDEVLDKLDEIAIRMVPIRSEHSIAWILWHLARIEDVSMNILVAGTDQIFERQGWGEKLNSLISDTGNEFDLEQVTQLSKVVNLDNLKKYRIAVGLSTQQIVSQLSPALLKQKVNPDRIIKVRESGAVMPAASGILDYWSKRTIAGLLLMPPTRHCFLHLNEALRIKRWLVKN